MNTPKETHTSIDLSKFLQEKGFLRPSMGRYDSDGVFILGYWDDLGVYESASYDLLWDICIRYGKEIFDDGIKGYTAKQ